MKKEIKALQTLMAQEGLDMYFIPSGDDHSSEYVHDHYKTREFLTGLSGESGEVVVTKDSAWLWTDARFYLQAERVLKDTGITLMRAGEEGVPDPEDFMASLRQQYGYEVLGFDGETLSAKRGESIRLALPGIIIREDHDLADAIWPDRPELIPSKIYSLPLNVTGKTASEKMADVKDAMVRQGADTLLISDLTETAWLFNKRASDVSYIPVFFSYALISKDSVNLYLKKESLDPDSIPEDISFVTLKDYTDISTDLSSLKCGTCIWLDGRSTNDALYQKIPEGVNVFDAPTPVELMKAVKNETELESTRTAHLKDAIAVTKFLYLIKKDVKEKQLTELDASRMLLELRKEQGNLLDLSFETITGYGPNGAIVHYAPTPETNAPLKAEGFLLADSGGQYLEGTTDITRTVALGPLTDEMKQIYTLVLKGHLAMAMASLSPDATGLDVDRIAREPLRKAGYDFKHGLGHGVGHLLACHEGPNILRRVATPCPLLGNMTITDEPGLYLDGKFGVRIENELLIHETEEGKFFTPLTLVPYEREAIDASLLTYAEFEYLNAYHEEVRMTLLPYFDGALRDFLVYATEPIHPSRS